jgi:4-aminobutyrate aminotransferase-like enzyme
MGAVITTREIADAFDNGMEFFSSFGGNPVSCSIGLKVLDIIENNGLQENALRIGNNLINGFERLKEKYSIIGDVRGSGLFIGIELVLDRDSLQPANIIAKKIVEKMRDNGTLLSVDGILNNVIKIKPPMFFTNENVKELLNKFEKALNIIQ